MKAWIVREYGHFGEALSLDEMEVPTPKESEAIIRIEAIGLNYLDILSISGGYQEKSDLPFVPGVEAAGQVVGVGADCPFKPGDRVMTIGKSAFAEFMSVTAHGTYKIPADMSFADAAAFQLIYQTSYVGLIHRARLKTGEFLLVHAGAGGVGTSAIQIGLAAGARIIATAGNPEKLEICRKCGAEYVIDYRKEDFVEKTLKITDGRGADVIYDPVGGDVFDGSTRCIGFEGRILVIGFAAGRIPEIKTNRILLKNIDIIGLFWGNYHHHDPARIDSSQEALYRMYGDGKLRPVIYRQYPFGALPDAMTALAGRNSHGKVIVLPPGVRDI